MKKDECFWDTITKHWKVYCEKHMIVKYVDRVDKAIDENEVRDDTMDGQISLPDDDPAEFNDKELDKNEEFNNHLGDILTYIISDSLEKKKGQIGHINTNTDTRTQSST